MSEGRSARPNLRRGGGGRRLREGERDDSGRVVPIEIDLRAERNAYLPAERPEPREDAPARRGDDGDTAGAAAPGEVTVPRLGGNAFGLTTFVVLVIVPTVLTALFYLFLATNQYATTSQFAVRGANSSGGSVDVLGMVAGISGASSSESSDSYIILDFINSRELIDDLRDRIDLRAIYDRPEADFYYRFDPTKPVEDFVEYLKMMILPEFDTTSGIITLTVRAFRPEDAQLVAENVIAASERLVNEISRRAREDVLRGSREEVARAEQRMRLTRATLASFRGTEADLNPGASATAQQTLITGLESSISAQRSQLGALLATMTDKSPLVVETRRQIAAYEEQLKVERAKVGSSADGQTNTVLNERLRRFEELMIEQSFAERAYTSALASLEAARMDADRQQRYVSVFVSPRQPEYPLYPQAMRWTAFMFGLCLIVWGLLSIVAAGIRDHFV